MSSYKGITWKLEDHLCRACGGRILSSVTGAGMTPGGNPIFKCSLCGQAGADMSPSKLCWCGFSHKMNHLTAYTCVPFSVLKDKPELKNGFLACGCDPDRGGEVGIMLEKTYRDAYR